MRHPHNMQIRYLYVCLDKDSNPVYTCDSYHDAAYYSHRYGPYAIYCFTPSELVRAYFHALREGNVNLFTGEFLVHSGIHGDLGNQ